jgi:hypothetical protein
VREEGSLGEEEVILPYKNRSIVGYLGVVYIFFRGYIFVGSVILTLSVEIKEGLYPAEF